MNAIHTDELPEISDDIWKSWANDLKLLLITARMRQTWHSLFYSSYSNTQADGFYPQTRDKIQSLKALSCKVRNFETILLTFQVDKQLADFMQVAKTLFSRFI